MPRNETTPLHNALLKALTLSKELTAQPDNALLLADIDLAAKLLNSIRGEIDWALVRCLNPVDDTREPRARLYPDLSGTLIRVGE